MGKRHFLTQARQMLDQARDKLIAEYKRKKGEPLSIGVYEGGGFGDSLIDMLLCQKLKAIMPTSEITFYSLRFHDYFTPKRFPFLIAGKGVHALDKSVTYKTDLVLIMHDRVLIERINANRVKDTSPVLYRFCNDLTHMHRTLFEETAENFRFEQYGILRGRHRTELMDVHNILGISRHDRLHLVLQQEANTLSRFSLTAHEYIVINNEADNCRTSQNVKLWPTERYVSLCRLIQKKFSGLKVVVVGGNCNEALAACADINLMGKTSLAQMDAIMKNALLYIGGEGGLAHLRHFLCGGPSIILFGPTEPQMYGYEENINISHQLCPVSCCGIVHDWQFRCAQDYDVPKCMEAISVEEVFAVVQKLIKSC